MEKQSHVRKSKRTILKYFAIVTVLMGAFVLAGTPSLDAVQAYGYDEMPSLVQRLADKFNLNEDEVKNFFNEIKNERHERMHDRLETKLSQAVIDGEITEDQKQAILDKLAEMQSEHEELMSKWFSMNANSEKAI